MFKYLVVLAIIAVVSAWAPSRFVNKAATAFIAASVAVAPAAFAGDIDNGAQVFAGNCAACHAGGNNVIQSEKTLRKNLSLYYLNTIWQLHQLL